ncbi:DUF305 domain-containing protein [Nocardia huaxiensis]|uniref:DUF305 domain-containing protein n=1 Tax=Nocardia huaxiensis TaxID=2755382 RepID=UPI001E553B2D|nr:DUF305 domain-containing protein [Nocardia huaxiensis]UFS99766.1 DUF305 domain-containing protein [Nocardia huaxiensis]
MARSARVVRTGAVLLLVLAAFGLGRWSAPPETQQGVRLTDVDIGFAQDMSTHHDQAVLLAQTLAREVTPQIRALADQMSTAQTAEIAMMRGWLDLSDLPRTSDGSMRWMGGHEHGGGHMPGLASTGEITRLAGSRGTDAEVLFLQLMVRHHRGGVDMAQFAYDHASNAQVKRTALEIVRQQAAEIGVMTTLLAAREANPLPYP